ncbi:hypothetical protein AURDEDRAFT_179883 [Auricularia subglabra TFB-10046 SS5]|nr:hypothetical protein AURDEDRAFT_179883 [Auricularia subglabra TFB-10046 SS5]
MPRLNLTLDEATLLKAYRVSSLRPGQWEDIDHEAGNSLAGALTSEREGESDPLGLLRGIDVEGMDIETKASILISSKSFDPKAFLSTVHPNATYQDLASGVAHLRTSLESRSEAIRILVEDNFDRFVAVKSSTDTLYETMRDGLLADAEANDYGVKGLRDKLKQAAVKADQVFLPVLENASKATKVRSTLGVLERSKFFFNLPGALAEYIEQGKYEAAMRDYKKGKFLLDTRPGQLLPGGQVLTDTADANRQQRRIFDKVWTAVEQVMAEMKNLLVSQLKDPARGVDEQEKTIDILLELNVADPVWVYLDAQHKHIMDQMQESHKNCRFTFEDAMRSIPASAQDRATMVKNLTECMAAMETKQPDPVISRGTGFEVWTACLNLVKNDSEVMLSKLPSFWRIGKGYIDGRFKKLATASSRSPQQARTMALDIIKLYVSLLSEFFSLSDKSVVSPGGSETLIFTFLPQGSCSLTAGYYLMRTLNEITECVNDVAGVELGVDANSTMKSLLESARWIFVDALAATWRKDAGIIHMLETWELSALEPSITHYLSRLHFFQKHNLSLSFKIAGGVEPGSSRAQTSDTRIPQDFANKICKTFFDTLTAFMDGLLTLATEESPVPLPEKFSPNADVGTGARATLDFTDPNTRLLLVVSNFTYMGRTLFPSLINQFETSFAGNNVETERRTLMDVVQEMDRVMFDYYIKQKAAALNKIVRDGILNSGIDWYDTPRPTEIRTYMYDVLLFLVGVHAQVNSVAKSLLERTLHALVEDVAREALDCFSKIEKFGMGGMLRATLEIEFMHQTLVQYVTPAASQTLTQIYAAISQAYTRKPGGTENLQLELDGVKRTLSDTRRATAIDFLCFRPPRKEEKERDRDRERPSGTSRAHRGQASVSSSTRTYDSERYESSTTATSSRRDRERERDRER